MSSKQDVATLVKIGDSSLTVANPAEDLRGFKVVDLDGEEIGKVDDLLIDEIERRVRMLQIAHGGFLGIGESHYLVPVDAVKRVDADKVHIDRSRQSMSDVPGYSPELAEKPDYYPGIYTWWGYGPYWAPGYVPPAFPIGPDQEQDQERMGQPYERR
jgi:sporulation protein YlmC with PRC-barrel domain